MESLELWLRAAPGGCSPGAAMGAMCQVLKGPITAPLRRQPGMTSKTPRAAGGSTSPQEAQQAFGKPRCRDLQPENPRFQGENRTAKDASSQKFAAGAVDSRKAVAICRLTTEPWRAALEAVMPPAAGAGICSAL
mmetsp:Transcript_21217/g.63877  ORF Transcript_21217/g.63877 Transcript_21217/m.63877 type:complete len:135 (+) Transcript_21217:2175-2579(+)